MRAAGLMRLMPAKHRLLGAVVGGVVAGLVLSVWMLIGEVVSHTPSQLTEGAPDRRMVRQHNANERARNHDGRGI